MKITLGFSPCPNDTFIFDALVNNNLDTGDLEFDVILEDVETLNQLALKNILDFTKISYGVLPLLLNHYIVLNSGSALGTGVGPLLITQKEISPEMVDDCTIAIPGENTTAHLLFSLAFPHAHKKVFMRYNEIEDFVLLSNENVAGVIIHENRFTYQQRGLRKIIDLGEVWEQNLASPIPLGGIAGKRTLPQSLLKKVDNLIKQSIEYSFSKYPVISGYVRTHSLEIDEDVMRQHIDLYVNDYSIALGEKGKNAIQQFLSVYTSIHPGVIINTGPVFLV